MYEFKLADLGEGMHEAEIVEWLIHEGDTAKLDQTIARVETDKAIVELPAPVTGRVSEIRVKDGQVAKVGETLVVFETTNAANGGNTTKKAAASSAAPVVAQVEPAATESQPVAVHAKSRIQAAPAVRKLAFELGVNLEQVTPSGASGRISLEDVRAYAEHARTATPATSQNGVASATPAPTTH
ncbi:MAG: biotin/lipoyl-containing protein, partial [Ktedonobacteraceae bacterium]